jgi:hypothetical protein
MAGMSFAVVLRIARIVLGLVGKTRMEYNGNR